MLFRSLENLIEELKFFFNDNNLSKSRFAKIIEVIDTIMNNELLTIDELYRYSEAMDLKDTLNYFKEENTQEEFLVLEKLFGSYQNVVSYGHTDNFLDYQPPIIKDKVEVVHGKVVEEIKLYCTDDTSDKVYNVQIEKVNNGYVVNYQNGKRNSNLTEGTKTEAPLSLENAKEIFDALVKSKNKYTTDPSGVVKTTKLKIK